MYINTRNRRKAKNWLNGRCLTYGQKRTVIEKLDRIKKNDRFIVKEDSTVINF